MSIYDLDRSKYLARFQLGVRVFSFSFVLSLSLYIYLIIILKHVSMFIAAFMTSNSYLIDEIPSLKKIISFSVSEFLLIAWVRAFSNIVFFLSLLGPFPTSNFSCVESKANEFEQRILLIYIRFGTWKVRRLKRALLPEWRGFINRLNDSLNVLVRQLRLDFLSFTQAVKITAFLTKMSVSLSKHKLHLPQLDPVSSSFGKFWSGLRQWS